MNIIAIYCSIDGRITNSLGSRAIIRLMRRHQAHSKLTTKSRPIAPNFLSTMRSVIYSRLLKISSRLVGDARTIRLSDSLQQCSENTTGPALRSEGSQALPPLLNQNHSRLVNTRRLKNGISGNRHFVAWIDFTASGSGVVWTRGKPANSK